VKVDSASGAPPDEPLMGALDGQPLVFLPRPGRGHKELYKNPVAVPGG